MPFTLFLALKYLKPKRSVTSVITCVSVFGVMLGVAALVIVRSIFAGFGDLWNEKLGDLYPHATVMAVEDGRPLLAADELTERISKVPGVTGVTPQLKSMVMVRSKESGKVQVPFLLGVDSDRFTSVYKIVTPGSATSVMGTLDLESEPYAVALGVDLAHKLGVWVGGKVQIGSVKMLERMAGGDEKILPMQWTVVGVFNSQKYDIDSSLAVVSLENARELLEVDAGAQEIVVRTAVNPQDIPRYEPIFQSIREAVQDTRQPLRIYRWREGREARKMMDALDTEKSMTTLLMALITVVAVFCVMNTLLILIVQKTPEIGLLKALGFSNRKIMGAFITHGMIQCVVGIALGLGLAYLVTENLDSIVAWINGAGRDVFSKEVYGLGRLPSRWEGSTVILATSLALGTGFLASLIPAWIAASKNPVEALNK